MIKSARQERHLTQEELGKRVGVQKAQISKLESSANSATIDTILKVFKALKAEINFNVKLEDNFVKLVWEKKIKKMGTSKFDIADYLDSNEMIAEYLNAVLEAGDDAEIVTAIGHIAKAIGMTKIAG